MQTTRKILRALTLTCLGVTAFAAQASYVWLEQPEGQSATAHFGEFGENQRAKSPGLLDRFGKPTAIFLSGKEEKRLDVNKSATSLVLSGKATKSGESVVFEDQAFLLRKLGRDDKETMIWLWPGARYITDFSAQKPKLTLDITPTGKAGEFKVTMKGKPVRGAKVRIFVQSGWMKSDYADKEGLVHFDLPWRGQYVVDVSHTDRTPGERMTENGPEKYDVMTYATALTFVLPDGATPFPPATPHPQPSLPAGAWGGESRGGRAR
jgi:hypothetical protein